MQQDFPGFSQKASPWILGQPARPKDEARGRGRLLGHERAGSVAGQDRAGFQLWLSRGPLLQLSQEGPEVPIHDW
jgi:hypothetical protein